MAEAVHPPQSILTLRMFGADTAHMWHTQPFPNARRVRSVADRQSASLLDVWWAKGLRGKNWSVLRNHAAREVILAARRNGLALIIPRGAIEENCSIVDLNASFVGGTVGS
jgi:hypothetical protein